MNPPEFLQWYAELKRYNGEFPAIGTICGSLVVLHRLKVSYTLDLDSQRAPGKAQIRGVSKSAVLKVLSSLGENRPLLQEGGRTNRGLPGDIESLFEALERSGVGEQAEHDRLAKLESMQLFLVEELRRWHDSKRIDFEWNDRTTTRDLVKTILESARNRQKEPSVAQYLVGAKLAIRFPGSVISNHLASAADTQTARQGDFELGDTIFHVTVSPMSGVYEKITRNLNDSLHAYLLVPNRILSAARGNSESKHGAQVTVESIENFVGGNLDELAVFSTHERAKKIVELVDTYNARVGAIESDKSLLLELPDSLVRLRTE